MYLTCTHTHTHTHTFADPHPLRISLTTIMLLSFMTSNPIYQAEDEGGEDCDTPGEIARLLMQEEKDI